MHTDRQIGRQTDIYTYIRIYIYKYVNTYMKRVPYSRISKWGFLSLLRYIIYKCNILYICLELEGSKEFIKDYQGDALRKNTIASYKNNLAPHKNYR